MEQLSQLTKIYPAEFIVFRRRYSKNEIPLIQLESLENRNILYWESQHLWEDSGIPDDQFGHHMRWLTLANTPKTLSAFVSYSEVAYQGTMYLSLQKHSQLTLSLQSTCQGNNCMYLLWTLSHSKSNSGMKNSGSILKSFH